MIFPYARGLLRMGAMRRKADGRCGRGATLPSTGQCPDQQWKHAQPPQKALLISRGTGFSAAKSLFCKQGWQCVKVWIAS